jgi:hypothetical protein
MFLREALSKRNIDFDSYETAFEDFAHKKVGGSTR